MSTSTAVRSKESLVPLDVLSDEFKRLGVKEDELKKDGLLPCITKVVSSLLHKTELELQRVPLSHLEKAFSGSVEDDLQLIRVQILLLIETGGYGAVYQALHDGKRIAIKIPKNQNCNRISMGHEATVSNRLREVQNVQQNGHLYSLDGVPVFVSELRKGDLQTLQVKYKFSHPEKCRIVQLIYDTTMELLEKSVYQLDNRIENILWDGEFPNINIYLTDFETAVIAPKNLENIQEFIDIHTYEENGEQGFRIHRNKSTTKPGITKKICDLFNVLDKDRKMTTYQNLQKLLKEAALFNLAATLYEELTFKACVIGGKLRPRVKIADHLNKIEGLEDLYKDFILNTLYQ